VRTQVKKQDGLHLCRDLRERTVGLLGDNMAAERGLKGDWNCTVYMEEAFRHNTIKEYIYYGTIFLTLEHLSNLSKVTGLGTL
jgi:hypothetical protein